MFGQEYATTFYWIYLVGQANVCPFDEVHLQQYSDKS